MMKKVFLIITAMGWPVAAMAGIYPPAAGVSGTSAIARTDARFVSWANGNLPPQYGADVDDIWKTPQLAHGPATDDTLNIVCLGNGGKITLFFPHPIKDGTGPDFAVFENSFSNSFLELAFVEVSSDGTNFFRFPAFSDSPAPAGGFGGIDPTNIHNLAGKYKIGFGTPFDLVDVPASPLLDKGNIRFVRLVDIIGGGATKDSRGLSIYDPTPVIGSGGFDLEAVGVIHQNDGAFRLSGPVISGATVLLAWESNPGSSYRIETSTTLALVPPWEGVADVAGSQVGPATSREIAKSNDPKRFWRVVRLTP